MASISQPADEFTFGHTGHMAIILGRYVMVMVMVRLEEVTMDKGDGEHHN